MIQYKKCLIEAHLVKSTAGERLPKPRGKGTGAEVGAAARAWLAVRRTSALLSLMRRAIQYLFLHLRGIAVVAFCDCLFLLNTCKTAFYK